MNRQELVTALKSQETQNLIGTFSDFMNIIDNIVRKVAMNEVITGERPAISEINDMCKTEKIENPDGAKRMGFCL